MNKYINSLKTGELLVDMDDYDLYVTEEGYNIPMPSTKELKHRIIHYLENTIEGINFRKNDIPKILENMERLMNGIEIRQDQLNKQYEGFDGSFDQHRNTSKYIRDINANNVNQLGDLNLALDSVSYDALDERIFELVNEFNIINTDFRNGVFVQDIASKNKILMELWTEIEKLMEEANSKLNNMGRFKASAGLKRNESVRQNVYDAYYSKRQFNFTLGGFPSIKMRYRQNITSQSQYLQASYNAREGFAKWFFGQLYLDALTRKRFPVDRGSGLWYKGFRHKKDERTGSYNGRRHYKWDLFENVPLEGQNNTAHRDKVPSLAYVRSASNFIMFDNPSRFHKDTKNAYATKTKNSGYRGIVYNQHGTATWTRNFKHISANGTYRTNAKLMAKIVKSDNGKQRHPRYVNNTKNRRSCHSSGYPSFPIIGRDHWWISHTNLDNREALNFRIGLTKQLTTTTIRSDKLNFNEDKGWT